MEMDETERETEELAERLAQYRAFLDSLFEKRKQLEKFSAGMKGIRESAMKMDRVIIKEVEGFFVAKAEDFATKKPSELPELKDLIRSLGMDLVKLLEAKLKERRNIDKYFDQAVENLLIGIEEIDKMIKDKVFELLQNIENTHMNEMNRLKIQIADLVAHNDELKREIEALKAGLPKKPKEIPELPLSPRKSIQCPVCLQLHEVEPGTTEFKCPICSYLIKVES